MQPRCGTGGDKSGRLYFCRPISRHGNHLYPQSLSRSTSLISAVTVSFSISAPLSLPVSISVPQASLRPAYLLSLIARSEVSQQCKGELIFFIFHLFYFILPLYASIFFPLSSCPIGLAAQL